VDIPSGTGREGAVKYTDFAIGRFIERAQERRWFEDTIFVITADHGANARGTSRIPVDKYRIPVLVYSPAHVAPRRVDRLMSQIDIPPTLLGLLGVDYYSKFLGRDLLRADPSTDRAFIANYQTLGYLKGDRFVTLTPKRGIQGWRLAPGGALEDAPAERDLVREAIAFYQYSSYAFRAGLLGDEEQIDPALRARRDAPARESGRRPVVAEAAP
jgi:phosphoglycerol transferase MdoB-like AlkP superfamily enzyme